MPTLTVKLTEKEKRSVFKQQCARNYRASLQLEGFDIELTKQQDTKNTKTEAEQIKELLHHYAR